MCLGDKAWRENAVEKITQKMWVKIETLNMIKFLAHNLCLKKLLSFQIVENKSIMGKLMKYKKITNEFQNIEIKLDDVDNTKLVLISLPSVS